MVYYNYHSKSPQTAYPKVTDTHMYVILFIKPVIDSTQKVQVNYDPWQVTEQTRF